MRIVLLLVVAVIVYLLYAGRFPIGGRAHEEVAVSITTEAPPTATPASRPSATGKPGATAAGSPSSGLRRPIDRARAVRDAAGRRNTDIP